MDTSRVSHRSSIKAYEDERKNYDRFKWHRCEYVKSKLENNTIAVSNVQCSEILKHFHVLRCKLNPEKYSNKHVLHGKLTNINLIKFCYYISNVLVCLSHDIVYAINNEIKKYQIIMMK